MPRADPHGHADALAVRVADALAVRIANIAIDGHTKPKPGTVEPTAQPAQPQRAAYYRLALGADRCGWSRPAGDRWHSHGGGAAPARAARSLIAGRR
ncbi:MAG TPA: hypothetical protein VGQ26_08840 [Streptosporangiaceae bacterium]|nr:hypothetical protein [Streptosporangiaceae bacterium]